MSIKHFAAPALVAALLVGCDMPAATPPTSASTSPAPGASQAPAPGASAGVSVGTGAVIGGYAVGKKYNYTLKGTSAGKSLDGTITWEVVKVEGSMVTIKQTSTVSGMASPESTVTFDASKPEGSSQATQGGDVTLALTNTTKEAVTVAAGTYANATKYSYTMSGKVNGTMTSWADDSVGLVKNVTEMKIDVPATPSIPGLPGGISVPGAGGDLNSTTTMELQSVQ